MELFLRFNLGPLHLLNPLMDEILESLGENFNFLRKENHVHRLSFKDMKILVLLLVHTRRMKRQKEISKFPTVFWLKNDISQNEQE